MITSKETAIAIENVSKSYKLYQSKSDQLRDLLKRKTKYPVQEFFALKNVNLNIYKGQRLAIVGRNGAGKTTLLKMITENFRPTSGKITVNGKVQALINVGIGFHPEFSGYENIRASLTYNGLSPKEIEYAIEDIIEFVELGDFIHQPVKAYSLGMQSRLYFATATAIKPEILIVDEVLGAGDAYFSAKSADRMKKLTNSGCTLLLVSHATSQVLQFCEQAVWMECGEIIKQGEAIEIVKAYEAYSKRLEFEHFNHALSNSGSVIQSKWLRDKLLKEVFSIESDTLETNELNELEPIQEQISPNSGGIISRWPSKDKRLQITNVKVLNEKDETVFVVNTGDKIQIEIEATASELNEYDCIFSIVLFTEDGRWVSRHCSELYKRKLDAGDKITARLVYDNLYLGNGKFVFTASIYKVLDLDNLSTAVYYDLLGRSFEFQVIAPQLDDTSLFHPPAKWFAQEQKCVEIMTS